MNKSSLKQELSRLEGFENPEIELEQYMTPPELAADIVWAAFISGDLEGKVVDLGAGTGILGIGAALVGANVTLVEKDSEALEIARENIKKASVDVKIVEEDIKEFEGDFDTVLMNPPFSVHSEALDQFLSKASEADVVYTLANADGNEAARLLDSNSFHAVEAEQYRISLPATFGFHTENDRETEVSLIAARKR